MRGLGVCSLMESKMRKSVIALGVAGVLLGGCASNGRPSIEPEQITAVESQVQQTAAAVCGFIPTISTVVSILSTFSNVSPVVGIVNQVAKSICDAVAPAKMMLRRG